jgi:hypothetical protein
VRLGDLNPRYLRHEETLEWVEAAERLFRHTEDMQDPTAIWQSALDLGLPIEELLAFIERQRDNLIMPNKDRKL